MTNLESSKETKEEGHGQDSKATLKRHRRDEEQDGPGGIGGTLAKPNRNSLTEHVEEVVDENDEVTWVCIFPCEHGSC